jgi:c-di-GMP-binding flagellar brake protein YcgR
MTLRDTVRRFATAAPGAPGRLPSAAAEVPTGSPRRAVQRRGDVRVDDVSDVHVGRPKQRMIRCTTVDLSASGLRAVVPELELWPGEEVEVFLRMENGVTVEARASVVRCDEQGISAFRFVEIDTNLRELLIRHVFAEQRRALVARSKRR